MMPIHLKYRSITGTGEYVEILLNRGSLHVTHTHTATRTFQKSSTQNPHFFQTEIQPLIFIKSSMTKETIQNKECTLSTTDKISTDRQCHMNNCSWCTFGFRCHQKRLVCKCMGSYANNLGGIKMDLCLIVLCLDTYSHT